MNVSVAPPLRPGEIRREGWCWAWWRRMTLWGWTVELRVASPALTAALTTVGARIDAGDVAAARRLLDALTSRRGVKDRCPELYRLRGLVEFLDDKEES